MALDHSMPGPIVTVRGATWKATRTTVSNSLKKETVTAPNGAVATADALAVNEPMGAHKKTADEITKGVYHIRGWGIAHTIAIDAPEGWTIVDTGDSSKTAADMRNHLEEKVGKHTARWKVM